ncbi:MAG: hypothetical protein AB1427_19985 [Thermodesulfobacteriota bacterium]
MRIPAYQIYNVLQQYTDQLTGGGNRDANIADQAGTADDSGFFATIKRREVIETIRETIKKKVDGARLSDRRERETETQSPEAVSGGAAVKNGEFSPFIYNVIDKDHRKVKRTIAVTRFYEP